MRSLSFITKYSPVYRSPVVEIYVDERPVCAAIPLPPSGKKGVESERSNRADFTNKLNEELTKEEHGLMDYEISAIIEYLSTEELFREYTYEKIKALDAQKSS